MQFLVRAINGTSGSAIAIRQGLGEERKVAVFPDAAIQDHALVGSDHCVLVSRKRGIALVDLASAAVVRRARLSLVPDRICVAGDRSLALAYRCNPGLLLAIDPATLEETAQYNLLQARSGTSFGLLHRDHDTLRREGTPWDSIPFSNGVLADEVAADDLWLKYGSGVPTGLRRMRFTSAARARFRADGKVVVPFEFGTNGPEWTASRHGTTPIRSQARDFRVGVAVVDPETAEVEMQVIRRRIEPGVSSSFGVRAISPDGTRAILQSFDPVAAGSETEARGAGGIFRKLFGRKEEEKELAFGLEVWSIEARPQLLVSVPFRPLRGETLLPTDTQRFGDADIAAAQGEIDLVFPGVEAAFAGRTEAWRGGPEKRKEDAYFDPLETRQAPAFNPAFQRVHYPPLFAETMRRLVKLHPAPLSEAPWEKLGDRQRRFVAGVLTGWSRHSAHAALSMAWSAGDRLVVLSRDGTVREISLSADVGPAYRLVDPAKGAWPFSTRDMFSPELLPVGGNTFAVDLYNERVEFELPAAARLGAGDLAAATPLAYRVVRDGEAHAAEIKQVDRLTEKIRRGYVTIGSKDAARVIAGLQELAGEVRDHLAEIVVDHRWLPSLFYRGKAVTEAEFCEILVADGSKATVDALDGLLSAFLDATEGDPGNVWHPNDGTPAMGPVAFALIRIGESVPPSVSRFVARRDANHDMWTPVEFPKMDLPTERLVSPDLLALQLRLAIQDLSTGNVEGDLFELYRLSLAREVLRADPSRAGEFASTIIGQVEAQAPDLSWASEGGVVGVLEGIAEGLGAEDAGMAAVAAELRRRAQAHRDNGGN